MVIFEDSEPISLSLKMLLQTAHILDSINSFVVIAGKNSKIVS